MNKPDMRQCYFCKKYVHGYNINGEYLRSSLTRGSISIRRVNYEDKIVWVCGMCRIAHNL